MGRDQGLHPVRMVGDGRPGDEQATVDRAHAFIEVRVGEDAAVAPGHGQGGQGLAREETVDGAPRQGRAHVEEIHPHQGQIALRVQAGPVQGLAQQDLVHGPGGVAHPAAAQVGDRPDRTVAAHHQGRALVAQGRHQHHRLAEHRAVDGVGQGGAGQVQAAGEQGGFLVHRVGEGEHLGAQGCGQELLVEKGLDGLGGLPGADAQGLGRGQAREQGEQKEQGGQEAHGIGFGGDG